uniref:Uncharacterized protein n=1 Tax=Glossina brevipalpis TaxID=37001 RepID=A0A1A9X2S9_9MUSC
MDQDDVWANYIDEDIDKKAMLEKEENLTFEELEANKEEVTNLKLETYKLFKNDKSMEANEIYSFENLFHQIY